MANGLSPELLMWRPGEPSHSRESEPTSPGRPHLLHGLSAVAWSEGYFLGVPSTFYQTAFSPIPFPPETELCCGQVDPYSRTL